MSLRFDSIFGRPCTGSFDIENLLARQLFSALGGRVTIFGLRHLQANGKSEDVGLLDSRRRDLKAICTQIGSGQREIAELQSICPSGTGFTINSPQSLGGHDLFGKISDLFLAGLDLKEGGHPEKIYTTFYLGTYETGFGLHADPGEDTTMFVLDGVKDFLLIEDGGKEAGYSVEKKHYLAWRAGQQHSAANPNRRWSFTMNFAVGSPGVDGPVKYQYGSTKRVFSYLKT